jgi:hypothetical protein
MTQIAQISTVLKMPTSLLLLKNLRNSASAVDAFVLLQALCGFQNLRRCGSHPVILRQINPTHCASRVDQELCRPGDVVSIFPLALVHEIVPLDYFSVWIGKQWEGVARFLCQIA